MTQKLFGIIGKPVLHSRSPALHNHAFDALGLRARYVRLAVEDVPQALQLAAEMEISGFNVTSPFKELMFKSVDHVDGLSEKIKAINTVVIRDNRKFGYNTDAFGISESLLAANVSLRGTKVVILGAGGAARAAIAAVINAGALVTVANRTVAKARVLANEFDCQASSLELPEFSKVLDHASVIVNASATTDSVVPAQLLRADLTILESQYFGNSTLAQDAIACGARVVSARDWLLLQAVKAFEHFTAATVAASTMSAGFEHEKILNPKKIALIGLMGAGKTTVAQLLAKKIGAACVEVDHLVVDAAGKEIRNIVEDDGEAKFRAFEKSALKTALAADHAIISCGGGIVGDAENRKLLVENTLCIWLWANPKELASRIGDDPARPLLAGGKAESKLTTLLSERRSLYAEVADLVVPTAQRTPQEITERILYELEKITKH